MVVTIHRSSNATLVFMMICNAALSISAGIPFLDPSAQYSDPGSLADRALPTPSSTAVSSKYVTRNVSRLDMQVFEPACFKRVTAARPKYLPIVMDDYYKAIQKILITPDATIPHQWFLANDPDHTIRWYSNTCGIFLGARDFGEFWIAPVEVAHIAAIIADDCLTDETQYLGGVVAAEVPQGRIMVLLGAKVDPWISSNSSEIYQTLDAAQG